MYQNHDGNILGIRQPFGPKHTEKVVDIEVRKLHEEKKKLLLFSFRYLPRIVKVSVETGTRHKIVEWKRRVVKQQEKGVKLQYGKGPPSPGPTEKKYPGNYKSRFVLKHGRQSIMRKDEEREKKKKRRNTHRGGAKGKKPTTTSLWNSTSNDCPVSFPRENGKEHWEMKQNRRGEKVFLSPLNFIFRFVHHLL